MDGYLYFHRISLWPVKDRYPSIAIIFVMESNVHFNYAPSPLSLPLQFTAL